MISAADRKQHAQAVIEVLDFMRRSGLALQDLIEIGGADLTSSNPKHAEKARRVSQCWESMARLSVKFSARGRRGEGVFSQVIENKEISGGRPDQVKSLKTNNKTDNRSVEASAKGRWRHKRQLVPGHAMTRLGMTRP
jgi:hypothetical protein